jgi:hypothetical protein
VYRGATVVIVGLILSAPLSLPMYTERATTKLSLGWSLAVLDGPTLHHLLSWSNYRFRLIPLPPESQHWYGGYFGLTLILIALVGILLTVQTRSRPGWPRYLSISLCAGLAFILPFASSSNFLKDVPLIPNLSGAISCSLCFSYVFP